MYKCNLKVPQKLNLKIEFELKKTDVYKKYLYIASFSFLQSAW